jgi:hypothetical protein
MNHPLLSSLAAMEAALDEVAGVDPLFMGVTEKKTALVLAARVGARLEALRMRLLVSAADVAIETGARSAAAWLANETREAPGLVQRAAGLADALEGRWTRVGAASAAGTLNTSQARVIVEALDGLPTNLPDGVAAKAETFLVDQAAPLGPRELRRLGASVLEHLAPEIAEAADYQRLLAQERRHRSATRLSMRPRGDGSTDLTARLPDHVAHRLRTYLDGYTSPRNQRLGDVDSLPLPRRRGLAFCALLENLPASGLPRQGGVATTISVKIDYQTLLAELGSTGLATTTTGDRITADQARRLACQAGILPHVMSGKSVVLDQGRKKRLHDQNQRAAIHLVHDTCATLDCQIPAARTEIHHPIPWARGGTTGLDGIPLCPFHHHRAHDPAWTPHHQANGQTTFTRRQ